MKLRPVSTALLTVVAFGAVACASVQAPLTQVLQEPLAHDGKLLEFVAYPFDLLQDPGRVVLCQDRCDEDEADRVVTVLIPSTPGRYDGYRGETPVALRVRFDAGCHRDGAICLHNRNYVFVEVPGY